ncbi:MAG: N-acetyltransferase [Firmicutes bacterium HGW-Firmicutes-4]|nr:MAG: N-acetyltransferase [Firmicutes bacterium HGW-Firmicutes-4]
MEEILLRRFEAENVPIFKEWLEKEHISKWYTEPEDWIDEVTLRQETFSWINHFIVLMENRRIGFCQFYKIIDSNEPCYANVPQVGTYSIDYLIGEEEYLGKGNGKKIIQLLTEMIFAIPDSERVVVQPEPENKASCNALLGNGYVFDRLKQVYVKEK